MQRSNLLFELSHPARIGILRLAAAKPVRHRDVMLASGLTPSEATRHAGRLLQDGFLTKDRDGMMKITNLGITFLDWLDRMEFISFNSQYFEKHRLGAIPAGFDAFSMLRKCEVLSETIDVMNGALQIASASKSLINCIVEAHSDAFVAVCTEKVKSGTEMNMMTGVNRAIPLEYTDCKFQKLSVRKLRQVPFFLVSSEARALLCFRDSAGKVDYSVAFASADTEFLDWCDALFSHFWLRGMDVVL